MDKTILSVSIILIGLGVGFLAVGSIDYTLSSAYSTGGLLWLVIGGVTLGLSLKVNRPKKQQIGALR
ncbi:MAG: hypothetical protein KC483_03345 [Nitrosarchaeum sp.]|nr:hypothetical protein [Nitrosarchaeum sp.]MCA9820345.1 hypothetical protein [Nitrosarchaeum sp.]